MMEVCEYCRERLGFGEKGRCVVCCNAFEKIEDLGRKILDDLKEYEFSSFDAGVRLFGSSRAMQEFLNDSFGIDDTLKDHFKKEFVKTFSELSGKRRVINGDISITVNLEDMSYEIGISSVYIYGRYKKRVRNLSQTRWICKECNGKGCEKCDFEGKKYLSVEELIINPALEVFKGVNGYLHGSGREDVDARMLGNGRPFVLEIEKPKRRKVDLEELEKLINEHAKGKVEVKLLFYADRRAVEGIKNAKYSKTYRAIVVFEDEVDEDRLIGALKELEGAVISQRTPKRVEHRRADLLRKRKVISAEPLLIRGRKAVIRIEAESGLYIKELVSGDEGRTKPSLSELLGVRCWVEKLDVIAINGGLEDGNLKYNPT